MPRIRSIKPEFFISDRIGALTPLARLMFVGLWTAADRDGRVEDRPGRLKVQLLPFDTCDPVALLDEIAATGLIVRYAVDGRKLIQIAGFAEHQRPHHTEQPSTLPPPTKHRSRTVKQPLLHGEEMVRQRSDQGMDQGKEEGEENRSGSDSDSPPRGAVSETQDFQDFWAAYPRRTGKGAALKAWAHAAPPLAACLATLEWQRRTPQWSSDGGRFVPHPATWLNRRGWEDEPPADPPADRVLLSERDQRSVDAARSWLRHKEESEAANEPMLLLGGKK